MWFGRSRVQDRAGDSDERGVIDDPTDRSAATRADESAPTPTRPRSTRAGSTRRCWRRPTSAPGDPAAFDNDRAIDALARRDRPRPERSRRNRQLDDIAQIRRLHDMRIEAEHRARRALPKPGARRRFQYALTAEAAALRLIGFAFVRSVRAVYGGTADRVAPTQIPTTRSRAFEELLDELGVDPHDDPLRAASEFLTTHEGATVDAAPTPAPPARSSSTRPRDRAAAPEPDGDPRTGARGPEPMVATAPEVEPPSPKSSPSPTSRSRSEHIVESVDIDRRSRRSCWPRRPSTTCRRLPKSPNASTEPDAPAVASQRRLAARRSRTAPRRSPTTPTRPRSRSSRTHRGCPRPNSRRPTRPRSARPTTTWSTVGSTPRPAPSACTPRSTGPRPSSWRCWRARPTSSRPS